jgi:hypothetical protein
MVSGTSLHSKIDNLSRVRKKLSIPDPGGPKKAPDPDPQHWYQFKKRTSFIMLFSAAKRTFFLIIRMIGIIFIFWVSFSTKN